jgi:opacity protein-like surface antigen
VIIVRALKVTLFSILTILLSGTAVLSQEVEVYEEFVNEPTTVRLTGLNFNGFYPRSTFKRNLGDEKGFGGGLFFMWQASPLSPHFLGINLEFDHIFSDVASFNGLEERVNSGYVSLVANWKIFPTVKVWKIEPYLEFFAGPNFIYTATSIFDENTGQNVDFGFDKTNFGFEFGMGVGVAIPVASSWFLDIGYNRTQTSLAQYFVLPENNIGSFREVNSSTDHATFKVGVIFAF